MNPLSLISRLLRRSDPDAGIPAPETPVCLIGDIHGCLEQLQALEAQLPQDMTRVYLGDYVDRGPDSAGVLRHLFAAQQAAPEQVICLMGNHESMLSDFLMAPARHAARYLSNGGGETLASLGLPPVPAAGDPAPLAEAAQAALGPELTQWIAARPLTWRSGNLVAVHAGADPARPLDRQDPASLIWGHPDFLRKARRDGLWIAHGHTIVREPAAVQGRIALDTGCYATGRLTAAELHPDGTLRFHHTGG